MANPARTTICSIVNPRASGAPLDTAAGEQFERTATAELVERVLARPAGACAMAVKYALSAGCDQRGDDCGNSESFAHNRALPHVTPTS